MVFSAPIFYFFFFPITLLLYFLCPSNKGKNQVLLVASLLYYLVSENQFFFIMIASTLVNFFLGIRLEESKNTHRSKSWLWTSILFNIGLLAAFKYLGFFLENINSILGHFHLAPISSKVPHLPAGISFYTFHSLSYLFDVYLNKIPAQRKLGALSLYVTFFPQLISGPIVRYEKIAGYLERRKHSYNDFSLGMERFILGLGKKVILADNLSFIVQKAFTLSPNNLDFESAWVGAIAYTLQIYLDFSGYSDMAIGMARIFGFVFPENFNYPYSAQSITDFWRRWHISLSSWFRDYVYIALGGNRLGKWRSVMNLWIVFLLCGLWHGASWTFVAWGAYHGLFLTLERFGLSEMLERTPRVFRHMWVMVVVIFSWVLFRAENLESAFMYWKAMVGIHRPDLPGTISFSSTLDGFHLFIWLAAVLASVPLWRWAVSQTDKSSAMGFSRVCVIAIVLILSLAGTATSTFTPFIYFRF